jgi:putative peptidoglycan lipid II flippase
MTHAPDKTVIPSGRRLAGQALLVMGLFVVGRVLGVVDDIVKAYLFGTGGDLGAYLAAFQLPDLLNNLISGGALAGAFIPIFADFLTRNDRAGAWRLASTVLNLTFLATLVIGLIIVISAPWLARTFIVPSFRPELQNLTADLMRFIVLSMVLFSISGVAFAILNAHQHFFLPAIAPLFYNVGVVGGALLLAPHYGVWGLAYGAVAGMLLNVLIQIPGLVHYGMRWQPLLQWRAPAVQEVLRLMIPRMAGVGVIYLNILVGINLASGLGDTAVASLSYAWRIQQILATIIGLSIGGVLFPSLAALAAGGEDDRLRDTFSLGMRVMLLLSVPAAFALVFLGRHAIDAVLRGGNFDQSSTDQVMSALQFYAFGLVGYCTLELVARGLFAKRDTRTPFFVASGALLANFLLARLLMGPLNIGGLALASTLAVSGEVLALLWILRRRMGGIDGRALALTLGRAVLGALVMGVTVNASLSALAPLTAGLSERLALVVELGVSAIAGLAVYWLVVLALGSQEVRALPALLLRRSPPN